MQVELLVLRLIHILGGVFWVGSALFTLLYLMPALAQAGPNAGTILANLQRRRLFVVLPTVALLTIASGLRLLWIVSGGDYHYLQHRTGHTYAVSGALAIVAFLVGVIVSRPAAVRMAHLSQMTSSAEMDRVKLAADVRALQRRAAISSAIVVSLLVLSAAGMAVARYL